MSMTTQARKYADEGHTGMEPGHATLLIGALAWFGVVLLLAANGAFVSGSNAPPIAVAVAFLTPILLFLAALRISSWHRLIVSISPVFLIALSGWRFVGLGFLMGAVEGLLPGGFAWPAGLGDIAMAVTAPFVAASVALNDRWRFGWWFLAWNVFGIADFLNAVALGTLYNWPGFDAPVSTGLMQRLPFALIPAFFVPLIAMSHITLLVQLRETQTKSAG
jgi:hypothetical protein